MRKKLILLELTRLFKKMKEYKKMNKKTFPIEWVSQHLDTSNTKIYRNVLVCSNNLKKLKTLVKFLKNLRGDMVYNLLALGEHKGTIIFLWANKDKRTINDHSKSELNPDSDIRLIQSELEMPDGDICVVQSHFLNDYNK